MDLADVTNSQIGTISKDADEGDSVEGATPASSPSKDSRKDKKKKRKAKAEEEPSPKKTKKSKQLNAPGSVAPPTVGMTSEEFCSSHKILVQSDDENFAAPVPMTTFESTPYGEHIRQALKIAGYAAPTPTQAQSWPIALSGRDIISVARTGSGKTLGFLLPSFHSILNRPGGMKVARGTGPLVVVLAPTRELACQISEEATKFGRTSGIRSTTLYGERKEIVCDSLDPFQGVRVEMGNIRTHLIIATYWHPWYAFTSSFL